MYYAIYSKSRCVEVEQDCANLEGYCCIDLQMLCEFCLECWCLEVEYDGANCQILCGCRPKYR